MPETCEALSFPRPSRPSQQPGPVSVTVPLPTATDIPVQQCIHRATNLVEKSLSEMPIHSHIHSTTIVCLRVPGAMPAWRYKDGAHHQHTCNIPGGVAVNGVGTVAYVGWLV